MVTVNQPLLDEEENNQVNQQQAAPGQAPQLGQGVSSANAGRSGLLSQRNPSSSGNFTDISKYKQANVQGSERMATGITSRIGQEAEGARTNINEQKTQFKNLANLAEQNIREKENTIKNPTFAQNILNPNNFNDAFSQLEAATKVQYEGPQGLSNVGQLQAQASNVKGLTDLTKESTGRAALLNRFYGRPDYTQGQKRLDTTLLGGQGSKFQDVRRESNILGQDVGRAAGEAIKEASRLTDLAGDVRNTALTEATNLGELKLGALAQEGRDDIARERERRANTQPGFYSSLSLDNVHDFKYIPNIFSILPNNRGFALSLKPQEAKQLGLYNYNTNVDLNRAYSTDELAAMADPNNISQLNSIRSLIGKEALQPGQRVQQGSYSLNEARAEEIKNEYSNLIKKQINDIIQEKINRQYEINKEKNKDRYHDEELPTKPGKNKKFDEEARRNAEISVERNLRFNPKFLKQIQKSALDSIFNKYSDKNLYLQA